MTKYYLNGGDAFRLKLWIDKPQPNAPVQDTDNFSKELEATA